MTGRTKMIDAAKFIMATGVTGVFGFYGSKEHIKQREKEMKIARDNPAKAREITQENCDRMTFKGI